MEAQGCSCQMDSTPTLSSRRTVAPHTLIRYLCILPIFLFTILALSESKRRELMAAALLLPPTTQIHLKPEAAALTSLLDKCSDLQKLQQIHAQMIKTGIILQTVPASKLLIALSKSSNAINLNYSLQLFNTIQEPNTFMWNTIIRAFSNSQNPEQAILIYSEMLRSSSPCNLYTFPFLLKACANLAETRQVHCHIIKNGLTSEIHTANSLLHIYSIFDTTLSARRLFDRIQCRDVVSWNSMIGGYAKSGRIGMARELFDMMEQKNVVSWTTMITGYVESCLYKEALELFQEMQARKIEPDKVALTSVLLACTHLGAVDQGRWIHTYIRKKRIELDSVLNCVLMDMYSKCGDLNEAMAIFREVQKRDVTSWTTMITGFAIHGRGSEALSLFAEMEAEGIKPNHITFTGVLMACSYAGMVGEGKSCFQKMVRKYKMTPSIEHYGCMVNLLGRAGLLKEVEELISAMPVKPNAAVWGALLSACRSHRYFELGRHVAEALIELEPEQGGRYVNLAGIFAAEGKWDRAAMVRKMMKQRGASKIPGCSSITLHGRVHEFFAGDCSHPEIKEIYVEWSRILEKLKKNGYVPEMEELLLDLEDEEKETAIHCHSERLAIAYGLIRTEPGATIQIVKNLRVCTDCHTVTKLISRVYSRKIVMRDRTRFHVFEDGQCSCKDYW